jgi:predicted AAA+ superfamily ATPase
MLRLFTKPSKWQFKFPLFTQTSLANLFFGIYTSNMQTYIKRKLTDKIRYKLKNMPAVAILGPRQCGKTTLAKAIISDIENTSYLDLERPSDVNKLQDPEAFFKVNAERLICLDEIQRMPELFPALRSVIDDNKKNGQFLMLGSASPELLKQSSETLAGRISYLELTPFLFPEIDSNGEVLRLRELWVRGGFPRSYLATEETASFEWRLDFIRTFLERDIPQLGFRTPAKRLDRFWRMCAHSHGQLLNSSKLGQALGVSHHTIRSYINMLEETFVVRTLQPYVANLKKRLVKSPKTYIRDSGLLHALLDLHDMNGLLGHPVYGVSWEGFVIENIISCLPEWRPYFYRTISGSEIDLILEKGRERFVVECKVSAAPVMGRGFWNGLQDLGIDSAWVVAPVDEPYPLRNNVMVTPLKYFLDTVSGS